MNRPVSLVLVGAIATAIIVALFVLRLCFFVVPETQQALVLQFQQIQGEPVVAPGLKLKSPIQEVVYFDKRMMRWDGDTTETLTADRKRVRINMTARWRITDAAAFYREARSVERMLSLLDQIIGASVETVVPTFDLYEVVRSSNRILETDLGGIIPVEIAGEGDELDGEDGSVEGIDFDAVDGEQVGGGLTSTDFPEIETAEGSDEEYVAGRPVVIQRILADVRQRLADFEGIELEDILIRELSYTPDIETNVYRQMTAELQKISERFRSQGRQRQEQVLGQMELDLATISSNARRRAEEIRGQAEARAIEIFAEAHGQDITFYTFLRNLEALEKTLTGNTRLVVTTDSPLYSLLSTIEEDVPVEPSERSAATPAQPEE